MFTFLPSQHHTLYSPHDEQEQHARYNVRVNERARGLTSRLFPARSQLLNRVVCGGKEVVVVVVVRKKTRPMV